MKFLAAAIIWILAALSIALWHAFITNSNNDHEL